VSVKESCYLIGAALLRISAASRIAALASLKNRPDEARDFLQAATIDISEGLAGGFLTKDDAEQLRSSIERYQEAANKGDEEAMQDSLAELTAKTHDIAFQKVVACECGKAAEA